jgi:hypothetical protein
MMASEDADIRCAARWLAAHGLGHETFMFASKDGSTQWKTNRESVLPDQNGVARTVRCKSGGKR